MTATKPFLTAVSFLAACTLAGAGDWLQFRGPTGMGITSDKNLPTTWSGTSNVVWQTALPGPGTSSPIIVGDKIYLTYYSGYGLDKKEPGDMKDLKRHLICVDRTGGKVLFTKEIPAELPDKNLQTYLDLHGYASSTPISDGKNVYVFVGKSGVFAFDLEGKQLWHASVGMGTSGWGSATSPVLHKNLLIVNAGVESGALIALDKNTGKEVWRNKSISSSWSTPVLVQVPKGGTELVVSGSKKVLAFDPENGTELWHSDSFNWYVCPTIVAHDGIIFALQNDACVAVRAGGKGDVTKSHTLWEKKFGAVVSSPVYHEGHLYWAAGTAYCLKADDGSVVYKERLKGSQSQIYASPLVGDGKIYYVTRTDGTFVVEAGPQFKLLAHNKLDPDTSVFNASPAVCNAQVFLRSDRNLYCIGKEK